MIAFELTNAAGQRVTGAQVELEGDMSHPGMSPVFCQAKEMAAGRYSAQLRFSMAGDWVVLFHITLPDGRKVEQQMPFPGVRN